MNNNWGAIKNPTHRGPGTGQDPMSNNDFVNSIRQAMKLDFDRVVERVDTSSKAIERELKNVRASLDKTSDDVSSVSENFYGFRDEARTFFGSFVRAQSETTASLQAIKENTADLEAIRESTKQNTADLGAIRESTSRMSSLLEQFLLKVSTSTP
jgi:hypothetical protein